MGFLSKATPAPSNAHYIVSNERTHKLFVLRCVAIIYVLTTSTTTTTKTTTFGSKCALYTMRGSDVNKTLCVHEHVADSYSMHAMWQTRRSKSNNVDIQWCQFNRKNKMGNY